MSNEITMESVTQLLAARPGYDLKDDCLQTEEIAGALDRGESLAQILLQFPHVRDCEFCRESVDLFSEMADDLAPSDFSHFRMTPRSTVRSPRMWWSVAALLVVGFCAGLGWFLWQGKEAADDAMSLTPKGADFDMEIAVSRDGMAFPLHQGEEVETGDQLGFFYTASHSAHLALFHVDATGRVSALYPTDSDRTRAVSAGNRIPLKDGAIVTPATSCEWTVAVFLDREMSVLALGRHITERLTISEGCDLTIDGMTQMHVKVQRIRN